MHHTEVYSCIMFLVETEVQNVPPSIHPLISSLELIEGGGAHPVSRSPGPSPGGMMGSSCLCQPVSRPGTVLVCLANITLTERREGGTGNPCRSVTGTKWCLPSRVLTCKQAKSQDTSELSWRMGRQLSSVTGPVDLEDHRSLHTQSFRNRAAQKSGRYI